MSERVPGEASSLFIRVAERNRPAVHFTVDGQPRTALLGDTLLTAMLTGGDQLRLTEFSGEPRAGFCLMGACQDCWVATEGGERLRACSTFVQDGMRLRSGRASA